MLLLQHPRARRLTQAHSDPVQTEGSKLSRADANRGKQGGGEKKTECEQEKELTKSKRGEGEKDSKERYI